MTSRREHADRSGGFTLIELLVSVFIIAVMLSIVMPNLLGARQRADDSKIKQDMGQMRNALQLYYNDYQKFPGVTAGAFAGCGATGTADCPDTTFCSTIEWTAGGTDCVGAQDTNVYMKLFPTEFDPTSVTTGEIKYYYINSEEFRLVAELSNPADKDLGLSQTRCPAKGSVPAYTPSSTYVICEK